MKNKQPIALYLLNFVSMWECFSFYGMRALLVLYMIQELHFSESDAFLLYASYITFIELGGIIGGLLADKWLGFKKAIALGGGIILVGHACMALTRSNSAFFLALGLIVTGTALFKPNILAFLGEFYEENDTRREAGYTLYYTGINVGGFCSSILCTIIADQYGWHAGFGLAAIGMLIGLLVLAANRRTLTPEKTESRDKPTLSGLFTMAWSTRSRFALLFGYIAFLAIFYACEEQLGSSLVLFAERFVDRDTIFGRIPSPMLISVNPLTILLFGAPLAKFLQRVKLQDTTKLIIGFCFLSAGFWTLNGAELLHAQGTMQPIGYSIASIFMMGIGELFIGPTVYSAASRLAPRQLAGLGMGIVTLGFSLANFLSGFLSQLMSFEGAVLIEGYLTGFAVIGFLTLITPFFTYVLKQRRVCT